MAKSLVEQFMAAWRVGTPLIAIDTPDPAATIHTIARAMPTSSPLIQWDVVRGWEPVLRGNKEWSKAESDRVNLTSIAAMRTACGQADPKKVTLQPAEMLKLAVNLPAESILFTLNAQRFLQMDHLPQFTQAVWNLRDEFKSNNRVLVMLGPHHRLSPELANDVLLLDEPLPTEPELQQIVVKVHEQAEIEVPHEAVLTRAVDALRGLPAFAAEQATAMCISKKGLDGNALWDRKRTMIEQTPGLSVWRGGETFATIGGSDQIKYFLQEVLTGKEPPQVIVLVDEIEKGMAGAEGDSTGVSQDFHGTMLQYMENQQVSGLIEVGPPGSGKSVIAKGVGAFAGIPTISLDLGGMKQKHLGDSEANIRNALKVISAIGRPYFIGTCNGLTSLSPELRRRFTDGIWFFDLPNAEERTAIWKIYLSQYDLFGKDDKKTLELVSNFDEGWTGAEIKQCARLAYRFDSSLQEAAQFVVPVSRSAADRIAELRRQANNKFLSASRPGVYQTIEEAAAPRKQSRSMKLNMN